jgi:hypothetical protein
VQAPRVTFVLDPDFDLDNTIFKSLDSQLNRVIMKAKLGNQVPSKHELNFNATRGGAMKSLR